VSFEKVTLGAVSSTIGTAMTSPISITQPRAAHWPISRDARAEPSNVDAQRQAVTSPRAMASTIGSVTHGPASVGQAGAHLLPCAFGSAPTRRAVTPTH